MYEPSDDDDDFILDVPAYKWSGSYGGASSKDSDSGGKQFRSPKTKPGVKKWVLLCNAVLEDEMKNHKYGHNIYVGTIKTTSTTTGGSQHRYNTS